MTDKLLAKLFLEIPELLPELADRLEKNYQKTLDDIFKGAPKTAEEMVRSVSVYEAERRKNNER
jgi:hypothetical protein